MQHLSAMTSSLQTVCSFSGLDGVGVWARSDQNIFTLYVTTTAHYQYQLLLKYPL